MAAAGAAPVPAAAILPLRDDPRGAAETILVVEDNDDVLSLAREHLEGLGYRVLAARDVDTRARRLATLDALHDVEILPVDIDVVRVWAQLRVSLAEAGRRINVNDLWIAATASRHGVPVVSQDDDFAAVDGMAGVVVLKV